MTSTLGSCAKNSLQENYIGILSNGKEVLITEITDAGVANLDEEVIAIKKIGNHV